MRGDTFASKALYLDLVITIVVYVTWLILIALTAIALWDGKRFKSKAEDVIQDASYLSGKHRFGTSGGA